MTFENFLQTSGVAKQRIRMEKHVAAPPNCFAKRVIFKRRREVCRSLRVRKHRIHARRFHLHRIRTTNLRCAFGGYNAGVRDFEAISILGSGAITLAGGWTLVRRLFPAPVAIPNERSLHQLPVPRTGGIAIWAGWCLSAAFAGFPAFWILPLAAVLAVSLVDDWRGLPPAIRLAVHAVAALAVVTPYGDTTSAIGWIGIVVDAVVVV